MDGVLNIDKPRGRTSFSVVAQVRRLSGERRVGHAGTLDPDAGGVLPVCLGRATRVIEYLIDRTKAYRAEVELGLETDTYDASGSVVRRRGASGVGREELEAALASFRGAIRQTPPMYSAIKHEGTPLYRLARAGVTVERAPRDVEVIRLDLVSWAPPVAALEIECSKGTYIRSIAHDLGAELGSGAILRDLVRVRCGPFHIQDAVSLSRLEEAHRQGGIKALLQPLDSVLGHMPAATVEDADTVADVRHGRLVDPARLPGAISGEDGALCRAYTGDGRLLAILRFDEDSGMWRPRKVLVPPDPGPYCGAAGSQ